MNHSNRQQTIIKSALIVGISVLIGTVLAVSGMYLLGLPYYTLVGIIGLLIGFISIILSVLLNRNVRKKPPATKNSLYDPRYEVYHRDYMVSRLEEEVARVKIQGLNLAVALLELVYSENQYMKDPETSTKLVSKAIKVIQAQLPTAYTLGYDDGNTFIVIMPEATEQESILLAQDMYAAITEKPITLDHNVSTDFKIIVGIVENNTGIQDTESALQLARRALLSAWGARYDSIGFVSGFRTASINTVQVEIVAFGAIGEFAVDSPLNETVIQQIDETIPVRPDDLLDFDLNISAEDDTLSVAPPIEYSNNHVEDRVSDIITQPISPFILDSLSDDYFAEVEEQNLEDIESSNAGSKIQTDRLTPHDEPEDDDATDKPRPKKDDLSRIEGIGPKYAEILLNAGISSFAQIAAMSEDEIVELIQANGGRKSASMSTWVEQAKLAAAQDWEGLEKFQKESN